LNRNFKRVRRHLVGPAAVVTVTLALAVLAAEILFEAVGTPASRGTKPVLDPVLFAPRATPRSATPVLGDLAERLASAPKPDSPERARARAALLAQIGNLRTPDSRTYLIALASRESAELVDRLAAVSALGHAQDAHALDEVARLASSSLVQTKVRAARAHQIHRGGQP
jgi:hypothetical protein